MSESYLPSGEEVKRTSEPLDITADEIDKRMLEWGEKYNEAQCRLLEPIVDRALRVATELGLLNENKERNVASESGREVEEHILRHMGVDLPPYEIQRYVEMMEEMANEPREEIGKRQPGERCKFEEIR